MIDKLKYKVMSAIAAKHSPHSLLENVIESAVEIAIKTIGAGWISVDDRLPIEYFNVTKHETIEILIVSGGVTEFCEFSCGPLPKPWYKFGDFHKGFVTHWMLPPEPPK